MTISEIDTLVGRNLDAEVARAMGYIVTRDTMWHPRFKDEYGDLLGGFSRDPDRCQEVRRFCIKKGWNVGDYFEQGGSSSEQARGWRAFVDYPDGTPICPTGGFDLGSAEVAFCRAFLKAFITITEAGLQ